MPKFLERKLKQEYGEKSAIPYKVMNTMGVMRGNQETAKGREMEAEHERDKGEKDTMKKQPAMPAKSEMPRRMEVEIHRGPGKAVTGFTVRHHMMPKPTKSPAFSEDTTHEYPFDAKGQSATHGDMMEHMADHLGMGGAEAAAEAPEEVDE
jgi:hypothetical protein